MGAALRRLGRSALAWRVALFMGWRLALSQDWTLPLLSLVAVLAAKVGVGLSAGRPGEIRSTS